MTEWRPTTEPNTAAMRIDPHTPVRVLATDLLGDLCVAYYNHQINTITRVREDGRVRLNHYPTSTSDLVPYRPHLESWALVRGNRVAAVFLTENGARRGAMEEGGTVIRMTPEEDERDKALTELAKLGQEYDND